MRRRCIGLPEPHPLTKVVRDVACHESPLMASPPTRRDPCATRGATQCGPKRDNSWTPAMYQHLECRTYRAQAKIEGNARAAQCSNADRSQQRRRPRAAKRTCAADERQKRSIPIQRKRTNKERHHTATPAPANLQASGLPPWVNISARLVLYAMNSSTVAH